MTAVITQAERAMEAFEAIGMVRGVSPEITDYYDGRVIHIAGALATESAADFLALAQDAQQNLSWVSSAGSGGGGTRGHGHQSHGMYLHEGRQPTYMPVPGVERNQEAGDSMAGLVGELRPLLTPVGYDFVMQYNRYINHVSVVPTIAYDAGVSEDVLLDPDTQDQALQQFIENASRLHPYDVQFIKDGRYEITNGRLYTPGLGDWHTDDLIGKSLVFHPGGGSLHLDKPISKDELFKKYEAHRNGDYDAGEVTLTSNPGDLIIIEKGLPHAPSNLEFDASGNVSDHHIMRESVAFACG